MKRMSMLRPSARSFANISILLSVVSGTLSLFFYFGDRKLFIILTTAPALSVIAGFIALAVIAYESPKTRIISAAGWAALALAVSAFWLSDFVVIDYASGYFIL